MSWDADRLQRSGYILKLLIRQRRVKKTDHKNNCRCFAQENYDTAQIASAQGIGGFAAKLVGQIVLRGDFVHVNPPSNYTTAS